MLQRTLLGLVVALSLVAIALGDAMLREQHHAELLAAKANPLQAFGAWMVKHAKPYAQSNDLQAVEARFRNWQANLEFKRVGSSARIPGFKHGDLALSDLPEAIDWREKGAVAEVKNQMACGSCWAFSTTGAIEGINKIVTGGLLSLSEQELVDCDKAQDSGCQGGLMDYAFEFVKEHGGIELEKDYPYTGEDGECSDEKDGPVQLVTIDGYQDVPQFSEIALKKAVSQQPVSVAIEADQRAFQLYMGGVFDDKECGRDLDHGVLVRGGMGVQGFIRRR
ncbi:hypothetical protein MNEG_12241 [Monoraphidium neglectum]|uniref:Peptidase C1A papain C-terminal domain-containing protein n=1 Tax=Monoraphidium neglectum TaxID=145388 RepID=A0A0D2M324_9CHLO|nr:hypothetical protein MNEG_12241 [Monoraphidium neglectum]KIY95721.1 hypothetical protein MNEG_12241 [Monoraphidium neglectum]|eukprot:XP_013894741.1 hypothetical protein MNEG_12241 [Monoraphidium neglectum]